MELAFMYLCKMGHVEGLFKISASSIETKHLIRKIDRGVNVDFFALNKPYLVAQIVKTYLRELPEPLIPASTLLTLAKKLTAE
eukprot:CAMPEP_0174274162 /NCGR_PEP_ID=MMETSP0439-20130205/57105_1 /TAXON_ID=0 /ORGANISM="Stereomyxa ramosa, Strain Chinc5" /LENGTH=82 /DNA_ID=CAMNT_0015365779 /DNA_START=150 /DNA_END=395 /DNA_ORIENTATION=-